MNMCLCSNLISLPIPIFLTGLVSCHFFWHFVRDSLLGHKDIIINCKLSTLKLSEVYGCGPAGEGGCGVGKIIERKRRES